MIRASSLKKIGRTAQAHQRHERFKFHVRVRVQLVSIIVSVPFTFTVLVRYSIFTPH